MGLNPIFLIEIVVPCASALIILIAIVVIATMIIRRRKQEVQNTVLERGSSNYADIDAVGKTAYVGLQVSRKVTPSPQQSERHIINYNEIEKLEKIGSGVNKHN
jgi:hypothetical protein